MTALRYAPDIETPEEDEQNSIDGIIAGMTQESRTVEKRDGQAVRASHARSTACVVGELIVAPDLLPELAQGLFADGGRFPVAVRFAQGPGEKLGDRVSTHRGMSIKVFGAQGERLAGHDAPVQDFVLASGPTFPAGTAAGFLSQAKKIGTGVPMPEGVKSAVSSAMRNYNRVLQSVGLAVSPTADFYGHPFSHPLSEPYYSQAPLRWGDYVVKLAAFPATPAQAGLVDWRLDPHEDEDGFRHATVAFFDEQDVVFELRAQLWADAEAQPIEDTSVEWSEADAPFRNVAMIRLPRQVAYGDARVRFFEEVMTFRPAHSLAAHRPLGGVMRARLQVYSALSRFRHAENGTTARNVADPSDIPA